MSKNLNEIFLIILPTLAALSINEFIKTYIKKAKIDDRHGLFVYSFIALFATWLFFEIVKQHIK